jgi:hypothetical protein
VESQKGEIFGRAFPHETHVATGKIECQACHRAHEERAKGEVVRFAESGCESCHHKEPKQDCLTCHASVRQGKVASFRGEFDHAVHIDDAEKTCADCHDLSAAPPRLKKEACEECH